jgi:hypothetical protein
MEKRDGYCPSCQQVTELWPETIRNESHPDYGRTFEVCPRHGFTGRDW